MKYRIIHNGEVYKIQIKYWWWLPVWTTYEPSMHRHLIAGYQPIDWSKYTFETIEQARDRIEELKEYDKRQEWSVVHE